MFRIALFVLLLFAFAFGFAWLADNPGTLTVRWPWLDENNSFEISIMEALVVMAITVAVTMMVWWIVAAILGSPQTYGRWRAGRRRDKGYAALSRGLIAAGAGNAPLAHKLSAESARYLDDEPLVALLDAQTALLEGKREAAREKFDAMLERDETRLLGLRGLYVEAEKEGDREAAAHYAAEAVSDTPGTPWAGHALVRSQALSGDWQKVLATLERNRSSGLYEKAEYSAKRAAVLTGLAIQEEGANPSAAKAHALAAHKLAPGLVPAAVATSRLAARLGDLRKASRVLETTWKELPHPDIAEAYIHLRSGDSALDRLKRAKTLAGKKPRDPESQYAIARASIDAGEWGQARDAMAPVLKERPSERACLLMADIEEGENGDKGRVREWLARAVNAPRDAAWTADGVVSDEWAPCSPVTGQLGAFEWKVPVEQLGGPERAIDYSVLAEEGPPAVEARVIEADKPEPEPVVPAEPKAVPVKAGDAKLDSETKKPVPAKVVPVSKKDDIEDAEVLPPDTEPTASVVKQGDKQKAEPAKAAPEKVEAVKTGPAPKPEPAKSGNGAKPVVEAVKQPPKGAHPDPAKVKSPYLAADLDPDKDGQVDHRPDDPGVGDEPDKKKALLF